MKTSSNGTLQNDFNFVGEETE